MGMVPYFSVVDKKILKGEIPTEEDYKYDMEQIHKEQRDIDFKFMILRIVTIIAAIFAVSLLFQ